MFLKRLVLICLTAAALASCQRKSCISYGVMGVYLNPENGAVIDDTLLRVVRYPKGNNFQTAVDTFSKLYNEYPVSDMMFPFDTAAALDYPYDLLCALSPSGRTFKITGISHANETVKPGLTCVNPMHYTVNGKEMVQNGYLGMVGFMMYIPVQ